jgi:nitroimidazol reductase NimA-like FMN-containing flavoprotein (pyridoxamine 5'-phosphate oxidase superfamily)
MVNTQQPTQKPNRMQGLEAIARSIIDANMYMTLGTADADGQPWVSPVYFASSGYSTFYWVSSPNARHSRNIVARPQISIVVFDSQASINTGQGVYMLAVAEELSDEKLIRAVDTFSQKSQRDGAGAWKVEEVQAPALYRLYGAAVLERWVLDPEGHPDQRIAVPGS